jgi:uncharacterized protein
MKIVIISDTHIPERAQELPERIVKEIQTADAVIHAGDFTSNEFYEQLKSISKMLYAVRGNMDDYIIGQRLPEKIFFNLGGKNIGLMHGIGAPAQLEDRIYNTFKDDKPDIIIFGHSHSTLEKMKGSVLILNPGSCTDFVFAKKRSFMILNIEQGICKVDIIELP